MKVYKDDMEELVYSIYGKELSEKDNIIQQQENLIQQQENLIQQQDKELKKYYGKLEKLAKIDNLPPDAKEIINSMIEAK